MPIANGAFSKVPQIDKHDRHHIVTEMTVIIKKLDHINNIDMMANIQQINNDGLINK